MMVMYAIAVCLLFCATASSEVYKMAPVVIDNPTENICAPEDQLVAVRNNISARLAEILAEIVSNRTDDGVSACGGPEWRQVAYLNMSVTNQTCPGQWKLYEEGSVKACGRPLGSQCSSVTFNNTGGEMYSKVCGRVIGYQHGSPDASHYRDGSNFDINDPYLDGVSITYGNPRNHIWSFFACLYDGWCCSEQHLQNVEHYDFLKNNFFSDTGSSHGQHQWQQELYVDTPLWDGNTLCTNNENCCAPHSGPWFYTALDTPTSNNIEVRICGDQSINDEDNPVGLIEVYTQ